MDLKKELRDQSLHFVAGAGAILFLAQLMPLLSASLSVAAFAYSREVMQRLSKGDKWYTCGSGCMLDLIMWAVGILFGSLIQIFVL